MAVTSTVMFLVPQSSLHPFSLFVIRVFCAGIYSISHWVKTHPKQATVRRHTPPHTLELLRGSSQAVYASGLWGGDCRALKI